MKNENCEKKLLENHLLHLLQKHTYCLSPEARPCTLSPSPGLLLGCAGCCWAVLGCRPLNDINDGWPAASRDPPHHRHYAAWRIQLSGSNNQLSPHRTVQSYSSLSSSVWSEASLWDVQNIAGTASSSSSSQAAKHALTRVIYHSAASSGWGWAGLGDSARLGDKLREPASLNTGWNKAKG